MKVRSGLKGDVVALWERHPAHPGGEVFLAGDRVVEVAETRAVQQALKEGRLVVVAPAKPRELTVDEVLAAVERGDIEPEQALEAEQKGKGRVTLIAALEAMLEASSDEEE